MASEIPEADTNDKQAVSTGSPKPYLNSILNGSRGGTR